jgi:hypothetical protein
MIDKNLITVPIIASLCESVITHPLDVIRTRFTNGTTLWRGLKGLYSGFGYRAVGLVPNRIVFLGGDNIAIQNDWSFFRRGVILGTIQSCVDLPFLMWRTSAMEGIPQTFNHFPKGIVPLTGRNILFALGLFGTRDLSPLQNQYGNTCLGCAIGVGISQPFEVIRVQKQSIYKELRIRDIIKNAYASRGVFGFWRGAFARGGIAMVSFFCLTFFQNEISSYF